MVRFQPGALNKASLLIYKIVNLDEIGILIKGSWLNERRSIVRAKDENHDPSEGSRVVLGDGRVGTVVENKSSSGVFWVRDDKGILHSNNKGNGWSSDGNWVNDIKGSK